MTDPIADMLTRIRNAFNARHKMVSVPSSRTKLSVLKVLQESGFISSFVVEEKAPQNDIKIMLKYEGPRKSAIRQIKRVSRPGGRVYSGYKELRPYLKGMGIRILSTPAGIMNDKEARKSKVGGEVLCEIW
ncbi:MAG: 30S ribosomal protein S8 [uncultured bacterium]|nr:MAG: 30S ribosomal protein S8 [uncultured bacterium]